MRENDVFDDDWSAEDDDLVRSALDSLRADVTAVPLAPVSEVKGGVQAPRRSRWLMTGAGLAAAGLVVAAVGLSGVLRSDRHTGDPAASSTTQSSTTTSSTSSSSSDASSSSLSSPATLTEEQWRDLIASSAVLLPIGQEWQQALGLEAAPTVADASETGGLEDPLCLANPGGTLVDAQTVTASGASAPFASERAWIFDDESAAVAALNTMSTAFGSCATPGPKGGLTPQSTDALEERPFLWSFTTDKGGAGWVVLTQVGRHLSYLELWKSPGSSEVDLGQIARLSWVMNARLLQADGGGSGSAAGPLVLGPPGKVPPLNLFVEPADFASPVLTDGGASESASWEFEGSPVVTQGCDADTSGSGVFGIMKVKIAGKDASFFASQRIRQVAEGESVQELQDRLTTGFTGCTVTEGQTTTTAVTGAHPGQFTVTTTFADGTDPFTEFVAITPTKTPGYVSTITLWVSAAELNHEVYIGELNRLSALAAQR